MYSLNNYKRGCYRKNTYFKRIYYLCTNLKKGDERSNSTLGEKTI